MNSTRFVIGQAIYQVIQGVATAENSDALMNPRLPIDSKGRKSRILFVLDRGDRLQGQPGQKERRTARIVVGVLANTEHADADADELHFAARIAMKAMQRNLPARTPLNIREVEADPELKEPIAEGALLLSAYEIEYYETYQGA